MSLHPKLKKVTDLLRVSNLTKVNDPFLSARGLELWIKRDDQIHPIVSGNKWRKLKFSLNHALHQNSDCIVSMGGPFSNFLHALAFVGQVLELKTIGMIRGEKPAVLSPTLQDIITFGMHVC